MNRSQSSNKNISIESQNSITLNKGINNSKYMIKRPSTQLKSRGAKKMDRKKGAGLTTGNESPSAFHKKNDFIDIAQTDVTIRNDDLIEE